MKKLSLILSLVAINLNASAPGQIKIYDPQLKEQTLSTSKEALLVALWATWCPDCKTKLKGELGDLAKDPSVEVLALNTEKNTKKVEEFLKEEKISVPFAYDKEKNFRKSLELFTVPAWAVYKKNKEGALELVDKGSPFNAKQINIALGKKALKE